MVPKWRRSVGPALNYPVLCGVLLFLSMGNHPAARVSWSALALNALTMLVALPVCTALHEAAHALLARALGFSVQCVFLGCGPALWTRKVGLTWLVLQRIPFTGATMISSPSTRWLRPRLMAVYAAGPLTHVVLLAASVFLLSDAPGARGDPSLRPTPIFAFALVNGLMLVMNTLPVPPRTAAGGERTLGTDGWNVLAAPFRDRRSLARLVTTYAAWMSPQLVEQGKIAEAGELVAKALKEDPESVLSRVAQTDLLVLTQRWSEAAPLLRGLMEDAKVKRAVPDAIPMIANNLAWSACMLDDPALIEEADRMSEFALARSPEHPALNGTRGLALLARGLLEDARQRMMFAFERNPARNKALNACCLAMLHARKGDRGEANTWLERARQLDPKCYLLARAEAAVSNV
jgi:hypothetical protein